MKYNGVSCNKCGWVHFEVSRDYVIKWLREWVETWIKFDQETRNNYGCQYGPPGVREYLSCFRCGNDYKDFKDSADEELKRIYGSTVQPILNRNDTV